MTSFRTVLISTGLLFAGSTIGFAQAKLDTLKQIQSPEGVGTPSVFLKNYEAFRNNQLRSGSSTTVTIPLGQIKGHSRSFTGVAGSLSIDLKTGLYRLNLAGAKTGQYYIWFIDQSDSGLLSEERSALLTSVLAVGPTATATGLISDKLIGFSIDSVVVTQEPTSRGRPVASGSIDLLQKLFFSNVTLTVQGRPVVDGILSEVLRFASLVPDIALQTTAVELSSSRGETMTREFSESAINAAAASSTPIDVLIKQGSKLFFEETFSGNGRTCGTCHPSHNNLTIDLPFMATLPASDPLFVAQTNPVLAGLEKPALMTNFGLILENLDGLDAPTTKFVMRSVPHTLGMTVSLIQDSAQPSPPAQMTGWSGDGAPGAGSLRDFATGAVTQHFTKSLNRVPNVDFILPSQHQLDAMQAFQLSLGRSADFTLSKLVFQNADVEAGRQLFVNGSGNPAGSQNCNTCHGNAGAIAANGLNRNFNTNVEDRIHPARIMLNYPIDGGFGLTANLDASFGNRTFNTPPVVEAADTAPFFHNNIVGTLEDAVRFYTEAEFSASRAPAGRFVLTPLQVTQIAHFLRGINTLQNIDIARRELAEILTLSGSPQTEVNSRLATGFNECGDVIKVLNLTGLYASVVNQVTSARQLIVQAQQINNPTQRDPIVQSAIAALDTARGSVATVLP